MVMGNEDGADEKEEVEVEELMTGYERWKREEEGQRVQRGGVNRAEKSEKQVENYMKLQPR